VQSIIGLISLKVAKGMHVSSGVGGRQAHGWSWVGELLCRSGSVNGVACVR